MDYKKEYEKQKLEKLEASFKSAVSLSMLAIYENDYKNTLKLNEVLDNFEKKITDNSIKEKLEPYKKLLALEYGKLEPKTVAQRLKLIKKCIEFDYEETLHKIALAWLLYDTKNYREAITLAEYLTTVCDTAPPFHILAKCYADLGMYNMSIKAYNSYLILNESDKKAEKDLNKVYKKLLDRK